MEPFSEECCIIYGFRIWRFYVGILKYRIKGKIAWVGFDWKKVHDSKWLIGFFHTHPGKNELGYSVIDENTMNAWVSCMWKDLLCVIANSDKSDSKCYLFARNKSVMETGYFIFKRIMIGYVE